MDPAEERQRLMHRAGDAGRQMASWGAATDSGFSWVDDLLAH